LYSSLISISNSKKLSNKSKYLQKFLNDKPVFLYKNTSNLTLNLNTDFKIVKIDKIFEIGNIDVDNNTKSLINLGLKFIPTFSKIDLFYYLYNFYISLQKLNNSLLYSFSKEKIRNKTKSLNSLSDNSNKLIPYLKKSISYPIKNLKVLNIIRKFRFEFLNNFRSSINESFSSSNKNLNLFNIYLLKKSLKDIKNKNIIITNADKNLGTVLIESTIYYDLSLSHLNDTILYQPIDFNPSHLLYHKCFETINNLFQYGHISKSFYNILINNIQNKKLPNFRILPKLHKSKFGIRPLINCSNSITSIISKSIDFFLKQLVSKHSICLRDSQQLIQILNNLTIDSNNYIFSADFESLYTNIPLDEAIEIITSFISKNSYFHFDTYGFNTLLKLVLKNNYFFFKTNTKILYFLQIKGVAMGTSCGPSVANLYLAYYEIKNLHLMNLSLYFRFIDDTFFTKNSKISENDFKYIFPNLNINITSGKSVNFLDLIISKNINNKFDFNLYIKPTNTFSYLLANSNHPSHIFKNIPKSLILRIRRSCSNFNDYMYHSSILLKHLLKRNFDYKNINTIIKYVSNIDRDTLIPYKDKEVNHSLKDLVSCNIIFDKTINFKTLFINTWNNILTNNISSKNNLNSNEIKLYFSLQPNLSFYFLNKQKCPFNDAKYNICNDSNCKICKFAITNNFLHNQYNIPISIPSYSNCNSSNVIYIISCSRCNKFYIGETSRSIKTRIYEHLTRIKYAIKNKFNNLIYKNFIKNNIASSILYSHFASNHCIESDFKFQVFLKDVIFFRLRLESDLILVFNTISPNGLNMTISDSLNSCKTYTK
jgi:hypothetical protein